MFTKSGSNGSAVNLRKALFAALALATLLCSFPVHKAYAWGALNAYMAGPINNIPSWIDVGDITQASGATYFVLHSPDGLTVGPSPSSRGAQNVTAFYIVERWDGVKWVTQPQYQAATRTIVAGGLYAFFDKVGISLPVTSRGYYRLKVQVYWFDLNGNLLGFYEYTSNTPTDYVCTFAVATRRCQSLAGSFQIGPYGANYW